MNRMKTSMHAVYSSKCWCSNFISSVVFIFFIYFFYCCLLLFVSFRFSFMITWHRCVYVPFLIHGQTGTKAFHSIFKMWVSFSISNKPFTFCDAFFYFVVLFVLVALCEPKSLCASFAIHSTKIYISFW